MKLRFILNHFSTSNITGYMIKNNNYHYVWIQIFSKNKFNYTEGCLTVHADSTKVLSEYKDQGWRNYTYIKL